MSKKYIVAIDLGTTGNRVFCFDESGFPISSSYAEFTQIFPKPGWVEHDPEEIWNSVVTLLNKAIKNGNLKPQNIISIGITSQRETTVLWNEETGKPVYNAIVWQCRRTSNICDKLKSEGFENKFREKTGLLLDAYFSGTKIKWILDNVESVRDDAKSGKILFGTIDCWILWKLTDGKSHKTDCTNACRTLIYNIIDKRWDMELLEILDIPRNILPEVRESASFFGETKNVLGIPDGIIIGGMAGDQQAAMVGQNCVTEGTFKNTYGTGCFLLQNTGEELIFSKNGLLTTLVCDNYGKPVYGLEGSIFIGGAVVQWLRDYMNFFNDSPESQKMAESIANKEDEIIFIPAFSGLGAPYWKSDVKGAIFGITRDTSREQIVRAALKSIAFQSIDVINAMQNDSKKMMHELRVDGGATANSFLMQFQADLLNKPVLLPDVTESTALGAAYLAGLTARVYNTIDEVAKLNSIKSRYTPSITDAKREKELSLWKNCIGKLMN